MEETINYIIDIILSRIGDIFIDILQNILSFILDASYSIALLGAGLAILFGLLGFEKYYKLAGGFLLAYVLINYLMR